MDIYRFSIKDNSNITRLRHQNLKNEVAYLDVLIFTESDCITPIIFPKKVRSYYSIKEGLARLEDDGVFVRFPGDWRHLKITGDSNKILNIWQL